MAQSNYRRINLQTKLMTTIKRIGVALLFTLLWTFFCYGIYQLFLHDFVNELLFGRSGENLFSVFLLDPLPESVTILQSQDDGFLRDYTLLHFKISPEDFNRILETKKWEVSSFSPSANGYYTDTDYPNTTRWNLQSLGKNASHYYIGIEYDGHKRFENIWVNSQKTEVYFEVVFIY
jgi:hypothetical protein